MKIVIEEIGNCYQSTNPTSHSSRAIWLNIPSTVSVFSNKHIAINITPACDLANNKTDSLIFLPIHPIISYFFLPNMQKKIANKMESDFPGIFPKAAINGHKVAEIFDAVSKHQRKNGQEKLKYYLAYWELVVNGKTPDSFDVINGIFPEDKLNEMKKSLIGNKVPGFYFLPAQAESDVFRIIDTHSIVLLRYPFSLPLDFFAPVFQIEENWKMHCQQSLYCFAKDFLEERPLSAVELLQFVYDDLIANYLSLQMRIGAPDYHDDAVTHLLNNIK